MNRLLEVFGFGRAETDDVFDYLKSLNVNGKEFENAYSVLLSIREKREADDNYFISEDQVRSSYLDCLAESFDCFDGTKKVNVEFCGVDAH